MTDLWTPYTFDRSSPVIRELWQSESALFNAFNTHVLLGALEGFRPDVVYVWNLVGLGGLGLVGCLKHLCIPWVWHLMDDVPLSLCRSSGKVVPALTREFSRQVRGTYLACSRQLVNEIEAGGVELGPDLEIVPNWLLGPRPPERTHYYRSGRLKIMYAGQIAQHKGVEQLIGAVECLRERGYEDFSVDIYGNNYNPFFPGLVHKHGLGEHVRFLGSRTQSELASLYARYDVFAFPTWAREPFAFAPIEAAAQGCVPLMSRVCGNSEWFVDGVHCLKADRTAGAFASILASILDGEIDLEPIGRRAAATVYRHLHIDTQIPMVENALERASRRSRVGAGKPEEVYHMAVLAEKLAQVVLQEPFISQEHSTLPP
jgi:glycosyltransferase involved in cell wall biosynthesis